MRPRVYAERVRLTRAGYEVRTRRYFGVGTVNYNVCCDRCYTRRTIGAADRKTALAIFAARGCCR